MSWTQLCGIWNLAVGWSEVGFSNSGDSWRADEILSTL